MSVFQDDLNKAVVWYKSLPVYAGTAIGFGLGILVTLVF